MNFVTFPVGATNIFPIANSVTGGQLVTEFNLRSRESVATSSAVKYMIGPSYVHSEDDYKVRVQSDAAGTPISTSTIEVLPGRGVFNGHYVETLVPMIVDLAETNIYLKSEGLPPLRGHLCIGVRVMYSTAATMAGSMLVENTDNMFEGVQLVILPKAEFKLPTDVPSEEEKVTAHIKLAEFTFANGQIFNVKNNYPDKCRMISADRVGDVSGLLSSEYITKHGMNPNALYVFGGKGSGGQLDGRDTWCNAVDSLMVWDRSPQITTTPPNDTSNKEAEFVTQLDGRVRLSIPHKQVDGYTDMNGNPVYYQTKHLLLPVANYSAGTSGTVDKTYTDRIKSIASAVQNMYRIPQGKQVGFLDMLDSREELPPINSAWNAGDYILVRQDSTVVEYQSTISQNPSTLYVVVPGKISRISYLTSVVDSDQVPSSLTGIEIDNFITDDIDTSKVTTDADYYNALFGIAGNDNVLRGSVGVDYFVCTYTDEEGSVSRHYYQVENTTELEYSNPLLITGGIPLAQEDVVGGFLNVPESAVDGGYVIRDENGHLRLIDYALLRSGQLAYQLGEDFTPPSGLVAEEVQNNLNEYVNQRIAFPNYRHVQTAANPNVIEITLNLVEEDGPAEINLFDIDSRFNTSIYLHIRGTATENTVINISDCAKIRIDNNIGGSPTINLYRSCLYYDASVIDYLNIIQDMSLWYARFDSTDPNLQVNGMTVQEVGAPVQAQTIEYWDTSAANDNHYSVALQSVSFDSTGTIIGCGLLVKNTTTGNVDRGSEIIALPFEFPQGNGLAYPRSKMTKQLKVTGSFISAYADATADSYIVIDTNFTALSQKYDEYAESNTFKGTISFFINYHLVDNVSGASGVAIDGWDPNTYHIFHGGVIS